MPFNTNIILENERVKLSPLKWEHFESLLSIALKHPDLLKYSPPKFGTEEDLKNYFKSNLNLQEKGLKCPFVIYDKLAKKIAGSTSYLNISEANLRLEIGSTWIAKEFQRTGLNRQCKFLLLQHAFDVLNYLRIEFRTDARNKQSQKAIEGLGAKFEGTLRSHTVMSDGHRRDTVCYSILLDEWRLL